MDSYTHSSPSLLADTGALMRRVDDGASKEDKKPGNMYQHLGDSDAERQQNLALFKAWVGNWTQKRFDALTKDDLAGIKSLTEHPRCQRKTPAAQFAMSIAIVVPRVF